MARYTYRTEDECAAAMPLYVCRSCEKPFRSSRKPNFCPYCRARDPQEPPPPTHCPICGQSANGAHCNIGGCPVGGDL